MPNEQWKPVKGFEGRYEVSNMGRVRSTIDNHGRAVENIRALREASNGYMYLNLWSNGKMTTKHVHKIVAEAFVEKSENAQCVNHKNGDKTDNRAENLEWCTYSENMRHAYENGMIKPTKGRRDGMYGKHGKDHPSSKPVEQYTLDGEFVGEYESGVEAGKALGVNGANIQRCAAGKRKTAHGFRWKYKGTEWRYVYDGR